MKRPLFWCCVLYLSGIYTNYSIPQSLSVLVLIILVLTAIIKTIMSRSLYVATICSFLVLSLGLGMYSIEHADMPKSLDSYLNRTITLTLRVAEKPEKSDDYSVFVCDILSSANEDDVASTDEKIRLTYSGENPFLSLGDIFTAKCRISKPYTNQNSGSFNYDLYLKTKGIFYTGYILDGTPEIISTENYTFSDYFRLLNMHLCDNIDSGFREDSAVFLKAIVLGEKSDMPSSYYSSFKRSGVSHIIAVSGMHLQVLISFLMLLSSILKIKKRRFAIFAIAFTICFVILTGMTPSVVRAGIMLTFVFMGDIFIRRSDPLTSLGLAALIITLINPYAAFSSSFILSFVATFGILTMSKALEQKLMPEKLKTSKNWFLKIIKAIVSVFCITIGAQTMTFPFCAVMFGEFSFWSLPANILISPVCTIILAGGFIFCVVSVFCSPLAYGMSKILSFFVSILNMIVNFFSSLDFGIIHIGQANVFIVVSFVLATMIFIFWLYNKKLMTILPLCMMITTLILYSAHAASTYSNAYVTFINTGSGDSALISLPGDIDILIDGGKYSYTESSNTDSAAINTYLKRKGVKDIDFLIASHAHSDHTGGLLAVMDSFNVGCVIIPSAFGDDDVALEFIDKAKEHNIPVYAFSAGSNLTFSEDISLCALMPDDYWKEAADSTNNTSLVLRLDCYGTSFLFTGDLEAEGERYMMRLLKEESLDVDILKVAHHGSKTSTTEKFLKMTSPQFAFIPAAEGNFNIVSDEVLLRLEEQNTKVFRADKHGNVTFVLTTDGINNIIYN